MTFQESSQAAASTSAFRVASIFTKAKDAFKCMFHHEIDEKVCLACVNVCSNDHIFHQAKTHEEPTETVNVNEVGNEEV